MLGVFMIESRIISLLACQNGKSGDESEWLGSFPALLMKFDVLLIKTIIQNRLTKDY